MIISQLLSNFQGTIVFIIFLGILVTVHEWGHFITAKCLGVRVEKFSLGFGPKLFSRIFHGTEFLVCLIPLGGYVKMAGDERTECKGKQDEFFSKSPGHRALIVLNGPIVNFLLAYICFVLVFTMGYQTESASIGEVLEGEPAYEAGLMPGDKVLEIDSRKIYGWFKLKLGITNSKNEQIQLRVLRDGQEMSKYVTPKIITTRNIFGQERQKRSIGISPYTNLVGDVLKGGPADQAGLKAGDQILQIDSTVVSGWVGLQKRMDEVKSDRLAVKILREGNEITLDVIPEVKKVKAKGGKETELRSIGVTPKSETELYKFSFLDSFVRAFEELKELTVLTYDSLYQMATGAMSAEEGGIGGPVMIFTIVKTAAEMGLSYFIYILAAVSASLAIFNLLPLIPLDGGHILLLGIEKWRGRPLSPKVEHNIMRVGFSLIILLAVFVFYMDFERIGLIEKIMNVFHIKH